MYVEPSSRDEQQMIASILAGNTERYYELIRSCDQRDIQGVPILHEEPCRRGGCCPEVFSNHHWDGKGPVARRAHHNAEAARFKIGGRNFREEVVAMILECKHVWDYISGYLDDSLSPETKELVQRHLEHCEICSAILDSTRNILILTADDRIFELPVGFSERLHARLAQEIDGSSRDPGKD
jgi:hypothetical protein